MPGKVCRFHEELPENRCPVCVTQGEMSAKIDRLTANVADRDTTIARLMAREKLLEDRIKKALAFAEDQQFSGTDRRHGMIRAFLRETEGE